MKALVLLVTSQPGNIMVLCCIYFPKATNGIISVIDLTN